MKTCLRVALALIALVAIGCEDPDENPRMYDAESVRWGTACTPFVALSGARFAPADEPCVELVLAGYYTRGDLTARFLLQGQEVGRSRIEFTPAGALQQRLARGAAESRVTFQLHHAGQLLPPSDEYEVALDRAGTEVARYPFSVGTQ